MAVRGLRFLLLASAAGCAVALIAAQTNSTSEFYARLRLATEF